MFVVFFYLAIWSLSAYIALAPFSFQSTAITLIIHIFMEVEIELDSIAISFLWKSTCVTRVDLLDLWHKHIVISPMGPKAINAMKVEFIM